MLQGSCRCIRDVFWTPRHVDAYTSSEKLPLPVAIGYLVCVIPCPSHGSAQYTPLHSLHFFHIQSIHMEEMCQPVLCSSDFQLKGNSIFVEYYFQLMIFIFCVMQELTAVWGT